MVMESTSKMILGLLNNVTMNIVLLKVLGG